MKTQIIVTVDKVLNDASRRILPSQITSELGERLLNVVDVQFKDEPFDKFHPTPTEAEINEAAEFEFPHYSMYRTGFASGVQWLQNYQTSTLGTANTMSVVEDNTNSPVILDFRNTESEYKTEGRENPDGSVNLNMLSEEKAEAFWLSLKEQSFSSDDMKLCYQRGFEDAIEFKASQPNPAIAVIEVLEAARAELYQFVPITDAAVLHKLTEAINSLKQIKP